MLRELTLAWLCLGLGTGSGSGLGLGLGHTLEWPTPSTSSKGTKRIPSPTQPGRRWLAYGPLARLPVHSLKTWLG